MSTPPRIVTTADDYGLTRTNVDTIMQTVDAGAVTNVSVLVNGLAFEYAIEQCVRRKVDVSLHLNLTEGRPVADPAEIPSLVTAEGDFRHSVGSLLVRSFFMLPGARRRLRADIARETRAQFQKLSVLLAVHGRAPEGIDGHQHVHMVPFVFDELAALGHPLRVRLLREPLYAFDFSSLACAGKRAPPWALLRVLTVRNRRRAKRARMPYNDYFLGFLFSGRMSAGAVRAGLASLPDTDGEALCEAAFHPGSAGEGERAELERMGFKASWHLSPWRTRERAFLTGGECAVILAGAMPGGENFIHTLLRYGISGLTSTVLVVTLLYVLTEWLHLWYVLSATVAISIAIVISYSLQKMWTFGDRRPASMGQFSQFLVLALFNIVANVAGLYLAVERLHIWYITAEIGVAATLALWGFFIMRYLIFAR